MLATYYQYWRLNVLTMLEYRGNFIMWFAFTVVYHGTAIAALWVTLRQFPSMNGWDFRQMAFLYALWMMGHEFHNTFFFTVVSVPEYVREGRFDRFLVRPQDALFQTLTVPSQVSFDGFVLAVITFIIATHFAGVAVNAAFIAFVPLVVLGGSFIDLGISLAVATMSFWFVRVDTLRWVVMSLEQEFTRYPISIYTKGVRIILAFVFPFAFMNYFPATYLLHKTDVGLSLSPQVGLLTPLIGIAWVGVSYAFWRIGLQHYQGTGS